MEAWLLIRNADYIGARESLLPLGMPALRMQPPLVQLHARVLAETLWILIDDEFNAVRAEEAKLKQKSSTPSVAFLMGVLNATPTVERAEWVVARAGEVLADDPSATIARRIRLSLYRLAELTVTTHQAGPPIWNPERVATAVRIEAMPPEERTGRMGAALAARSEGQETPRRRIARPGPACGRIDAHFRSARVLGAVLLANDKPADAVRGERAASRAHCRVARRTGTGLPEE